MDVMTLLEAHPQYHNIIPSHCFYCDTALQLNDNLTELTCPNPDCSGFLAARIEAMCKYLNVKGFGIKVCLNIVELHQPDSLAAFLRLPAAGLTSMYGDEVNAQLHTRLHAALTGNLSRAVQACMLPGLQSSADKIFRGYNNLPDFYLDFEHDPQLLLRQLKGERWLHAHPFAQDTTYKQQIPFFRELLTAHKDRLLALTAQFTLLVHEGRSIDLAITGEVTGYANKEDFVAYLNQQFPTLHLELKKSVTRDLHCLVQEGDAETTKSRNARKYGIPVYKPAAFVSYLEDFAKS